MWTLETGNGLGISWIGETLAIKRIGLGIVTLLALTAPGLEAQTVDTLDGASKGRVDRIAEDVLVERGVPSASVAVVKGGKLVYTHAYGLAHVDPKQDATPEMRYSIGSISKQFTAAAILLLQEQGKLSLDDVVGKYVPGLTRGNEVTIRQILSHTAGVPGLLAGRLPDDADDEARDGAADFGYLGKEAAGFRTGDKVAVFEYQLCDCRGDRRESLWTEADGLFG